MKRIAIVTITNGGANFGNRLQNYALQTVLERFGCVVKTIFTANIIRRSLFLSRLRWIVRNLIKRTKRQLYFDNFNKRYIHAAPRIRYQTLNDGDFARDGYDAAVAGSDQVWNPELLFNTDFEFLPFMPPEKRFAYAASFGVDDIPPHRCAAVARFLREMHAISVREDTGRILIKRLTDRDVPVHIDPTLLLDASEYAAIEKQPPQPLPARYVLTYFLGETSESYRAFIDKVSADLGLPVVEVNELRDSAFFNIGPLHFLYLVRHADFVCTDSYHGSVFSILFHRQFMCFYRQGKDNHMGSRLDTLLHITQLEGRLYNNHPLARALDPIDFTAVDKALTSERVRAIEYLRVIAE